MTPIFQQPRRPTEPHDPAQPGNSDSENLRRRRQWPAHTWPVVLLLAGILLGPLNSALLITVAAAWKLTQLVTALRLRDPARPTAPRRRTAPMPPVRPEPPTTVPVLADNCVICGRPLTNRQSMLARVGSTCIKTYGPRPAWQHNPDHDRWAEEWARARAAQAVEQVRLDAEHAHALQQLPELVRAWEDELASPGGVDRRARRRLATQRLASATGWLIVIAIVL